MKHIYLILAVIVLGVSSCMDMDIENLNKPDFDDVMQDPDAVTAVASGTFLSWFGTLHDYKNDGTLDYARSVAQSFMTMADASTTYWYNFACVDLSQEPREAFINDKGYKYYTSSEWYYKYLMGALTTATEVIDLIDNGMELGDDGEDTNMVLALMKFTQGLSNGYLGLTYNETFTIDTRDDFYKEYKDISTYSEAVNLAVSQIEEAIAICDTSSFTIPANWIPGDTYTEVELKELMHSYVARLLVYSARNKVQNDATDWTKVLYHAEHGIKRDFAPVGDGKLGSWFSGYYRKTIAGNYDWQSVDMRIVNMLDPGMPSTYPESGSIDDLPNEGIVRSVDDRINTDFEPEFRNRKAERGSYYLTNLRYKRFDAMKIDYGTGERIVEFRKAENDMIIAEAKVRQGDVQGAADIVNAGTRVTRGKLAPVGAVKQDVMDAIWYERNVELLFQGVGVQYFDMRRFDMLQKGTMLHFPFPADQLELMVIPVYTVGGNKGVAGEDYSIGGWK